MECSQCCFHEMKNTNSKKQEKKQQKKTNAKKEFNYCICF